MLLNTTWKGKADRATCSYFARRMGWVPFLALQEVESINWFQRREQGLFSWGIFLWLDVYTIAHFPHCVRLKPLGIMQLMSRCCVVCPPNSRWTKNQVGVCVCSGRKTAEGWMLHSLLGGIPRSSAEDSLMQPLEALSLCFLQETRALLLKNTFMICAEPKSWWKWIC